MTRKARSKWKSFDKKLRLIAIRKYFDELESRPREPRYNVYMNAKHLEDIVHRELNKRFQARVTREGEFITGAEAKKRFYTKLAASIDKFLT